MRDSVEKQPRGRDDISRLHSLSALQVGREPTKKLFQKHQLKSPASSEVSHGVEVSDGVEVSNGVEGRAEVKEQKSASQTSISRH